VKGPPLPTPEHRTVNDALAAAAATRSGITFVDLHEGETFLSFREIHARARRTSAALRRAGVSAGDRVALVFPTSPAFMDAYFGVLLAGAVAVPLYPPFRLGRLPEYHAATARMIGTADACLLLTGVRTRKLLGQAVERSRPRLGCLTLEDVGQGDTGEVEAAVDPEGLALIQFSSGSTTDPKPIALSHGNLMAQLAALKALLPPEDRLPQRGVSWLPLYHDMGLIGCLLLAVYYPGPVVLIPPEHFLARPALWLRAIARHRATVSVAPAFGYAVCTKRVRDRDLEGMDLSCWRLAVCGAEPIPIGTLDTFAQRFAPFGFDASALRPVYGLAEASLAVTFAPPAKPPGAVSVDPARLAATGKVVDGARRIVSVGTPVPGSEVEVRGARGESLPEREVGRIFTRGPSVMAGYFGQDEATAGALAEGWLDTGDLGFIADGELHVCGREKDLVIIRGANHSPQEFEECLDGLEGVRAGCVVAVGFLPDGADGEHLLVLAERAKDASNDGDAGTVELVRRAVLERTGIRPHTVVMLEPGTLPRTSSGKLRRGEALRLFLARELTPPRKAGPAQLAAELARSALALAKVKLGRGR